MIYDFERPIAELEEKLEELESAEEKSPEHLAEIESLKELIQETKKRIYGSLTPWQRVQLARHIARPHSLDYIHALFTKWFEVHGDRNFADDRAVVTGFAELDSIPFAIIGQQKGKDTKDNLRRNFGMMHPEGYRKALRVMKLADKFSIPIVIFIDTPGAYPGIGAEERGQAEAIANNIKEMYTLKVPIVVIIIGEGASGGALGVGLGDVVLMMENAWYCVISPEGCASILWRDRAMAPQSAQALKLTAQDLLTAGVIDEIIPEPLGGAHRDHDTAFDNVLNSLKKHLDRLLNQSIEDIIRERFQKYRRMGVCITAHESNGQQVNISTVSGSKNNDESSSG